MSEKKYVVAARVGDDKDCIVAPADALIAATHRVVYGPETKEKCEQWKRRHCR